MSRSMLLLLSYVAHGALAGKVGLAPTEVNRAVGMAEATLADKLAEATQELALLNNLKAEAVKAKTQTDKNEADQRKKEDAAVIKIKAATEAVKKAEDADAKASQASAALKEKVATRQTAETEAQKADDEYRKALQALADAEKKWEAQLAKELHEKQAAEGVLEGLKQVTDKMTVEAVSAGELKDKTMNEVRNQEVAMEKAIAQKDEASKNRESSRQEAEEAREAANEKQEELKAIALKLDWLSKRKEKMMALHASVKSLNKKVDALEESMTDFMMTDPGAKGKKRWDVLTQFQANPLKDALSAYNKVSKSLTDLYQNDAESYKVIWQGNALKQISEDFEATLLMICDGTGKNKQECGDKLWTAVTLVKEPLPGAPLER